MDLSIALSSVTDTFGFHELDDDADSLVNHSASIFGRDKERHLLLETYHQVKENKKSATVVLHGKSGMGKTSLVDMFRGPVINSKGYFCAGKFFQNSAVQEPYSAIMAAFSDLCDVIIQSEDWQEDRRSEIQRALGADGYLLTKVISNITPFLSEDYTSVDISAESWMVKFAVACKTFLQAMSSEDHPVVLFIDDIQWMDEGSKQLLDMFLRSNQTEFPNVLFILAYREEEADRALSLLQHGRDMIDIPLLPLDAGTIHQMVSSALDSSSDSVRELSELIHCRTLGNPFYVTQFLAAIEFDGLLIFNPKLKLWEFDVHEIQSSFMISDDLLDLITHRIDRVQDDVKEALKIASLIGYSFSECVLKEAATAYYSELQNRHHSNHHILSTNCFVTQESLKLQLTEAVKGGFIEKTKDGFQFCHDKIQAAFQSMIGDDDEVALLHHLIGESFLGQAKDKATIYNAAVHMNSSHGYYCSDDQLLRLMQINLNASKYCIDISAFAAASSLLHDAIGQTSFDQRWSDEFFPYAFEMTELLAKVELIIGNFDSCKAATQIALRMSKSTDMKLKSLLLEVEAHMANQEIEESLSSAHRAFNALGVMVPRKVLPRHIFAKYMKIKILTWRKSDAHILGLPHMINERMSTVVRLLHRVCGCCFMTDRENLAVYSSLKALEISLKYGLSSTTCTAFAIYALTEITLGNHSSGYRWGKLALRLMNSTNSQEARCATVAFTCTNVMFWKEPLQELKLCLYEAARVGFEIGDIVYGTYCMSQYFSILGIIGTNLLDFQANIQAMINTITEFGQEAMLSWITPIFQFVSNLLNHPANWKSIYVLTGEAMDEEKFMNDAMKGNKTLPIAIVKLLKASLACDFGFHEVCADRIEEIMASKIAQVSHGRMIILWAGSFSNIELYRNSRNRRFLRKARHFRKLLEKMDAVGCPDASTQLKIVRIYEMSVKETADVTTLVNAYNETLMELSKGGHIFSEGLLSEHACVELARRGCIEKSKVYYHQAMNIYENSLCSIAKSQHLLEQSHIIYSGLDGDGKEYNPVERVGTTIFVVDE